MLFEKYITELMRHPVGINLAGFSKFRRNLVYSWGYEVILTISDLPS